MHNAILGNGISAYVIAACLDYFDQPFTIFCRSLNSHIPPILLLKYSDEHELRNYAKIFDISNIEAYTTRVKVGYLYKGVIYDKATEEMSNSYLRKQLRDKTKSALSDSLSSFNAIRLDKIFEKLKTKYQHKVKVFDFNETFIDEINSLCVVYDTMFPIKSERPAFFEYLKNECKLDLLDYDYVYDCDEDSDVKRYSRNCTEYIREPEPEYVEILNYYDPTSVYINPLRNCIKIGRYATKTQTKQEDIINYMINTFGGIV